MNICMRFVSVLFWKIDHKFSGFKLTCRKGGGAFKDGLVTGRLSEREN